MVEQRTPVVSATGTAVVSERPTKLMMVGTVEATDATLQLAVQALEQKQESLSQWLKNLGAEVAFGEPRFSDQVEPDPMATSRRLMARQMKLASGQAAAEEQEKQPVLVSYTATWRISGMSSPEMLILFDRIRFEAENLSAEGAQDEEDSSNRQFENPELDIQAMMSAMTKEPESAQNTMLFSSCVTEEQREEALKEAYQDARRKARGMANAAGRELGELQSISSFGAENFDAGDMGRVHRLQQNPLLKESPALTRKGEVLSENPRAVDFTFSINATFSLVPSTGSAK